MDACHARRTVKQFTLTLMLTQRVGLHSMFWRSIRRTLVAVCAFTSLSAITLMAFSRDREYVAHKRTVLPISEAPENRRRSGYSFSAQARAIGLIRYAQWFDDPAVYAKMRLESRWYFRSTVAHWGVNPVDNRPRLRFEFLGFCFDRMWIDRPSVLPLPENWHDDPRIDLRNLPFTISHEREMSIYLPPWFLAIAFAIPPGVSLARAAKRRRRRVGGFCQVCGYDLRASAGACPECGSPRPQRSPVPNDGTVAAGSRGGRT